MDICGTQKMKESFFKMILQNIHFDNNAIFQCTIQNLVFCNELYITVHTSQIPHSTTDQHTQSYPLCTDEHIRWDAWTDKAVRPGWRAG